MKTPAAGKDAFAALERLKRSVARASARRPGLKGAVLVFGEGPAPSRVMIIGEAPGRVETRELRPFVGRAGSFFVNILEEVFKRPRGAFYITNVVKFWPTIPATRLRTRPPTTGERAFFIPYLEHEIDIVSPRVIIAVGKTAFSAILPSAGFTPGKWAATAGGIPVMAVYHPAYILRRQRDLKKNTDSMKAALRKAKRKASAP